MLFRSSSAQLVVDNIKGFYGNPITRFEVRFTGDDAYKVVEHIAKSLSESDKRYLLNSLEMRYDSKANKVFIRLDKQGAYLKRFSVLEGDDTIRVVLSFSILRSIDGVRKALEEIFFGR